MWADEREAGVALRALRDEPAPPPATTLEQVMRRGRRRVRVQRLSVVAVVVAVAAAGGGGALWLRSLDPAATEQAAALMSTPNPWPEDLPGWSVVAPVSCAGGVGTDAMADTGILPREVLEPAFVTGVAEVTGGPANLARSSWDRKAYVEVEVPLGDASGSVHLEATVTASQPPVAAADGDVGHYGTCEVSLRRTFATGMVMQLYAPDRRSPFAPVQHLRTYLPNGRLYVVSSAGWSRADDRGGVVRSGRGRLPLDSRQLADLAVRIAELE